MTYRIPFQFHDSSLNFNCSPILSPVFKDSGIMRSVHFCMIEDNDSDCCLTKSKIKVSI